MEEFKVIIAGGRNYDNYSQLRSFCLVALARYWDNALVVVSGGCSGADTLGERFAHDFGWRIVRFAAAWGVHGKAAGPIRNRAMAAYADALVVFPGGCGTHDMVRAAQGAGLLVFVCPPSF